MNSTYDVIAIGGGPAGIIGATTAAALGAKVALVDLSADLGGAGANTGTVPSKTLRETALALSGTRSRELYGVDLSLRRETTVADFLRHERRVKAGLNASVLQRLETSGADVYVGTGSFTDAHAVAVHRERENEVALLRATYILIATGSSPFHPPAFDFQMPGVYDSDTILNLDRMPESLAVVGAGVIGSEYASTFAALGAQVHLIEGRDMLLPFLDSEISRTLAVAMERSGVRLHWKERVLACAKAEGGQLKLSLSSGNQLTVDAILVAAGRKSNVEKLGLSAAGIAASDRGLIPVDNHFRTETPNVYAVGDVIGFPALASTSMQQARIAMRHAVGSEVAPDAFRLLPTGIYTIPEVGTIGETEDSLKAKGVDYLAGRGAYRDSARGRIIGDPHGFLKLLFRRADMKLLGVHMIGEQATDLVHIGMMAMLSDSTAMIFEQACFNVPTLGELYKLAALDAMSKISSGSPVSGQAATSTG
jgi:NAD(P) transhydrogenase